LSNENSTKFNKIQQNSTKFNTYLFAVVLLFVSSVAYGQLDLSRPISFQTDLLTPVPTYTTPEVDVRQLLIEDAIQVANGFGLNSFGQSFSTNITPNNTGRWETIEKFGEHG
jgi:hypothetical protein